MNKLGMIVVCGMLLMCVSAGNAQTGLQSIVVSGNVVVPSGDFGDLVGTGFGGTATGVLGLNEQVSLLATAGYLTYGTETVGGSGNSAEYSASAIPIMGGGRFYLQPAGNGSARVFVGGEVGVHIYSIDTKTEFTLFGQTQTTEVSASETYFSLAPVVGVQFGNIEVSALAELISDANYFGARVGYAIPMAK